MMRPPRRAGASPFPSATGGACRGLFRAKPSSGCWGAAVTGMDGDPAATGLKCGGRGRRKPSRWTPVDTGLKEKPKVESNWGGGGGALWATAAGEEQEPALQSFRGRAPGGGGHPSEAGVGPAGPPYPAPRALPRSPHLPPVAVAPASRARRRPLGSCRPRQAPASAPRGSVCRPGSLPSSLLESCPGDVLRFVSRDKPSGCPLVLRAGERGRRGSCRTLPFAPNSGLLAPAAEPAPPRSPPTKKLGALPAVGGESSVTPAGGRSQDLSPHPCSEPLLASLQVLNVLREGPDAPPHPSRPRGCTPRPGPRSRAALRPSVPDARGLRLGVSWNTLLLRQPHLCNEFESRAGAPLGRGVDPAARAALRWGGGAPLLPLAPRPAHAQQPQAVSLQGERVTKPGAQGL